MWDGSEPITAAAVQASPVLLDREKSLDKACRLVEEAGGAGADITVFPEGFIPAHPEWYRFHAEAAEVSRRLSTELFKNAVEVPGPVTRRLADTAGEAGTYVVMGVCERVPDTTGTMYNTQLFFSPAGELIGKHQKLKPTVGEQLVHAEGRKDTFGTVPTDYGPVSGLICGENSNPLAIFGLAAEHTRIHAMSWPLSFGGKRMAKKVKTIARAFAYMSKSFVVSANGVMDDRTIEQMELTPAEAEKVTEPDRTGGSLIVGPDQNIIAGPLDEREDILYGELEPEALVRGKLVHDFAGHYNRPDMFSFSIDTSRSELVQEPSGTVDDAPIPDPASNGELDPTTAEREAERPTEPPSETTTETSVSDSG
jgi:aliphatic nitrilase